MLFVLLTLLKLSLIILIVFVSLIFICALVFRFGIEPLKKGRCTCRAKLDGKVALITGGNSGIGLETAKDLAKRGAKVIIASRDVKKSEEAVKMIKELSGNDNVECRHLDLSSFSSVREFASEFIRNNMSLDILVNNAGYAGNAKNRMTDDGINVTMQINYVGPFLLTNLLIDKLIESKPSRIVNVTSYLHNFGAFDANNVSGHDLKGPFKQYAASKLCMMLWTKALAKILPNEIIVNALHPGAVRTNIFDKIGHRWSRKIWFIILDLMFKTAEEGAQTIIHLCVSPDIKASGDYYVDCVKYKHSKQALDEELVDKVWNETMKLVNK